MLHEFSNSPLITRRPGTTSNSFHVEPVLTEREFTRWLTLERHLSPPSEGGRTNDYNTELLDEFLIDLPERIAYWEEIRGMEIERTESLYASMEPPGLIQTGESVGTSWMLAYIQRLRWVAQTANDAAFCGSCHDPFGVVALALRYGPDTARRYWYGCTVDWTEEDWHHMDEARDELALQIDEERVAAVMFRPTTPTHRLSAVMGQLINGAPARR